MRVESLTDFCFKKSSRRIGPGKVRMNGPARQAVISVCGPFRGGTLAAPGLGVGQTHFGAE